MHTQIGWINLRERDHLEDLGVDVRIILKWILWTWDSGMDWVDLTQERQMAGACESGNETSCSIQYREFL